MPFNLQQLTDKLKTNKQKVMLGLGIILSLAAAFVTKNYIDQQRSEIQQRARRELANIQANQTAVLVAKDNIPKNKEINSEMLETVVVPNQYIQPQAVTSLDRIAGMTTVAAISKGEQITLSKLTFNKEKEKLSDFTPVGKRAITISVDNIAALLGMIKAGDYVDVIGVIAVPARTAEGKEAMQMLSVPLFQNVPVLAVGQETKLVASRQKARYAGEEGQQKETNPLITLALTPQDANLIAFVQEQGKIRLLLRSPADSNVQQLPPATWDTLLQYINPRTGGPKTEEDKPSGYIEVYRGLSKEKIPVYNK